MSATTNILQPTRSPVLSSQILHTHDGAKLALEICGTLCRYMIVVFSLILGTHYQTSRRRRPLGQSQHA
jgi:hypothetical protein